MLGSHAHIFCSAVHVLFQVKAVSAPMECVTFEDAERNEQKHEDEGLDQEKQCLVHVEDW